MAVKPYPTDMGILLVTDLALLPTCRLKVVLVYDTRGLFCMMPTECLDFTEKS